MTLQRLTIIAFACLGALPLRAEPQARFRITEEVVAPRVPPFTATVGGIGNGGELTASGGFEPVNLRTMFLADGGGPDSISGPPTKLSNWNSWTEGTFDGAEVSVLRIANGRFTEVRTDRVREGGFHASGWTPLNDGKPVPGDTTTFLTGWDGYNRAGATYHYTVRAVDGQGRLSPAAASAFVISPAKPGKAPPAPTAAIKPGTEAASLDAPAGLQARLLRGDGIARLDWQPVPGARGYVIYRSDMSEDQHRGHGMELDGTGDPVRAGDLVILRRHLTTFDRTRLVSNRTWGTLQTLDAFAPKYVPGFADEPDVAPWHLAAHEAGTPVADGGETFLRVDLPGGLPFPLSRYNHSGTAQTYYDVLEPGRTYRFEVWLRGPSTASASFALTGPFGGQVAGLPAALPLSPDWHRHVVEFEVPSRLEDTQVGKMALTLSGKGQVDVDNIRIYRADTPYLALLSEDVDAARDAGLSALRTHAFIKTGHRSYDLSQFLSPPGLASVAGGNTLPQTLAAIRPTGAMPWIQVEPHFSAREWLGLAEYLAAPADAGPWAARRAAQGQVEPWTDVYDRIYFEIGNETWNQLFAPWIFPSMRDAATGQAYTSGEVYGLYQEHVLSILEQSPAWPALAPHLVPVLGGWTGQSYGFDAARRSPRSRMLTHADYIGGWDRGEGPVSPTPDGFASVLAHGPQTTERNVIDARARLSKLPQGGALDMGTYESGPGYALNGLNGARVSQEQTEAQEVVMKGVAAGTATLDSFLIRMRHGDTTQNFFTFDRGSLWTSHAPWHRGGHAYPSWAWLGLLNTQLMGDMLQVRAADVPRRDLPAIASRTPLDGAPMIDVQALRRGDRLSVIVISRLVPDRPEGQDGHASVEVGLPIASARRLTRYSMTGDYRTSNVFKNEARIVAEDQPLPALPGPLRIDDLPPGEVLIYVFDGVNPAAETSP